jgi:hypothetical protein
MADPAPPIAGRMTEQRGTESANALDRMTLKSFDESTWKQIGDAKDATALFPALRELMAALFAFLQAKPGDKWYDRRVEFGRLVAKPDYVAAYKTGYERGLTLGLRDTLGKSVDDLAKELSLVVPSLKALAEIYLASPGTKPTGQQVRGALSPGAAAAIDVYFSPPGSTGSRQSREDLLKSTWVQGAVSAVKLLEEMQRRGVLKTLDYTAASLITALQSLGEKWIDGLFALNGKAEAQGQYVGKMMGAASAEIIWTAANFVAFEAATQAFVTAAEGAEALYQAARQVALEQRIAALAKRAQTLVAFLEKELAKDVPNTFYVAFVVNDLKGIERMLEFAGRLKGGSLIQRARQLKGGFILEELIRYNAKYAPRIAEIEELLLKMGKEGIWQPKVYRARRMWVWQYSSYTKQMGWMELGDGGLVTFPKPGAKTKFKMGLANNFESKAAGVVEKAAASPEFLAGQTGKNLERLDFDPADYLTNQPVIRVEVEGLLSPGDTTLVDLKPGELAFSRNPPRMQPIPGGGSKPVFGTNWTVVVPPDANAATVARTGKKLGAAGFTPDIWNHPMTDSQAQKIAEGVMRFVENEKK